MVDPVPYVASVANTATTEGGGGVESDADLAERVFLAPGAYSTAGPEDSYLYHAKAYSRPLGMWWPPATRRPARWILFSSWPTEQSLGRK